VTTQSDYTVRYPHMSAQTTEGILLYLSVRDGTNDSIRDCGDSHSLSSIEPHIEDMFLFSKRDHHHIVLPETYYPKTAAIWFRYNLYNAGLFDHVFVDKQSLYIHDQAVAACPKDTLFFLVLREDDGFLYHTGSATYRLSQFPFSSPVCITTVGKCVHKNITYYYDGEITPLTLWDRRLTDEEITYLYNEGKGRVYTRKYSYYFFY